ncbi:MAG: hypothetical protein ACK5NY_00495 [Burkholderiaceae bacterium]|jgi:hypothetical protein
MSTGAGYCGELQTTSHAASSGILAQSQVTGILRKVWRDLNDLIQALAQLPRPPLLVGNHGIQQDELHL